MATNYNDERLVAVQNQKAEMMEEVNNTYDSMINQTDHYYQAQVDATKQWEEKQSQLQQERTDFTIEQIEQQKEQAHKDYTKEQSASYVDWQKQSNQYGANAEAMASSGLTNTGYSESSQVNMYNTYQNRVATARDVYNRAVLNYNNSIKDAQLQNNSILAEIAYNSLYKQLEISLAGFQYKNDLIINKLNTRISVDNSYHSRYMDVLGQINTENSLAEQVRQFNEKMNFEKQQYNDALALQSQKLQSQKKNKSATVENSGDDEEIHIKDDKTASNQENINIDRGLQVNTAYYQGTFNPDVKKFGALSNGYQPRGISGHGNLTKTSKTIDISTQTLSGNKTSVKDSVWRASDGTFWYWDSRQNKYIQIKE